MSKTMSFIALAALFALAPFFSHLRAQTPPVPPVRITILGDSIDADEPPERPVQGWGTFLATKLENVTVTNLAASGRSTKTYMHGDHLPDRFVEPTKWIAAQATPADFWIIKFGNNDSHPATQEKHTDLPEFAANLKILVDTARQHGIKPILVTPFGTAELTPELVAYANIVRKVAQETKVPLIDLFQHASDLAASLGPDRIQTYVPLQLGGHLNRAGAELIAEWMAGQLVGILPQLKLASPPQMAK